MAIGVSAVKGSRYNVGSMVSCDVLLHRLKQIGELLRFSEVADNITSAYDIAVSIAREAPTPWAAELGANVVAAIGEMKREKDPAGSNDIGLHKALWRLRLALQEAKRS